MALSTATQPDAVPEQCPALACWRLDTSGQTLVLASWDGHLPGIVYWGPALPAAEDLVALAAGQLRPLGPGTLDQVAELSICPEEGRGFPGQPGLRLRDGHGRPLPTQFRLEGVEADREAICVRAVDGRHRGLRYRARFEVAPEDEVLRAWAAIEGGEDLGLALDWLAAPVLPLPEDAPDFIDYAGRWSQELGEARVGFARGVHLRESRRGRPGHDHFPAVVVPRPGATATAGGVHGVHFGWSGGHRMIVEALPDGRRQLQFGLSCSRDGLDRGGFDRDGLDRDDRDGGGGFESGVIHFAYAEGGLSGLGRAFQSHVRRHVVRLPEPAGPRPVHYNCWEAVYFDHDLEVLKDLAARAAGLGAERFVLDDGWFGKRDDATSGLGDWQVDPRKYPEGLGPLIAHVEGLGMDFGLWVEPEMVSLDSELARAHPDWNLAPAGYAQISGRGQQVLDLTRPAVAAHLFERLDALLSAHRIAYLKWDSNRDVTLPVGEDGRDLSYRRTRALYRLIDRLRARHPGVEIESCASGGARLDYGMLQRCTRVWLSDSNDARERWRMQTAAATFLPPEVVGSHVGPRRCHSSGRVLPMAFRAAVALTGHMGFELDLRELTGAEAATLRRATAFYKENRAFLHNAAEYRLETGRAEASARMRVDAAKSRFLLFAATLAVSRDEATVPLRLAGLGPDCRYRVRLCNPELLEAAATRHFPSPLLAEAGLVLSGAALMRAGLVLPLAFPDTLWILEGRALVAEGDRA
ncbi:MAG: alpha-galactosidase [Kiloniellales bacterium]|nr:alpha-galactosidase [Kiloniellales bacterium]